MAVAASIVAAAVAVVAIAVDAVAMIVATAVVAIATKLFDGSLRRFAPTVRSDDSLTETQFQTEFWKQSSVFLCPDLYRFLLQFIPR